MLYQWAAPKPFLLVSKNLLPNHRLKTNLLTIAGCILWPLSPVIAFTMYGLSKFSITFCLMTLVWLMSIKLNLCVVLWIIGDKSLTLLSPGCAPWNSSTITTNGRSLSHIRSLCAAWTYSGKCSWYILSLSASFTSFAAC